MKSWLSRLFGSSTPDDAAAPPVPGHVAPVAPDASVATPNAGAAAVNSAAIDSMFYSWITGGKASPNHAAEKVILDTLERLAETATGGANLVPRVPAIIPQLLKSLRDESVSGADLSRQITQDVVLVAEVIREANSPYYHPTAPIKNIEGAVLLLGQNGLRMLLARVSFRPVINLKTGYFIQQAAPLIWSASEKCAEAGNMLAASTQAAPFEAYLAGLMHHVGLIAALRQIDQIYREPALPLSPAFCMALGQVSRRLSARIATTWDFPPAVSDAILQMDDGGSNTLASTLALADRLSKIRLLVDAGLLDAEDPGVLQGLGKAALRCFDKLKPEEK